VPSVNQRRRHAIKALAVDGPADSQQMLAIGRALMARPRVLLLDEPSMGLAPMVISQIFKIISEINSQGTTVLLVEQNAQQALTRSDRAYILETGEVTVAGWPGSCWPTTAFAPPISGSPDRPLSCRWWRARSCRAAPRRSSVVVHTRRGRAR
jgi:ABC-type branched-subunit amino acid transport system ATPase component